MLADNLRKSILQAAIQGKLTEQLPTDGNAQDLLKNIRAERQKLIDAGKIKNAPPLPPISPDEIPFDIPENWQWVRLGDIFYLQAGKNISANNISEVGKYQCFGGNGLRGYVNFFNYEGDYPIIGRQGALCGNINFAKGKFYATEHAVVVSSFANCNPYWVAFFLKALNLNQYATATAQPGLAVSKINNVLIPLPPLAEQERIVAKVEELLAEIEPLAEAEKELDQLEKEFPQKIKASLLQAAIQGKLSEQLPTDGNAQDLLEKIRAERQKLIDAGEIRNATPLPPISPDEIPFDIPENWQWVRLGDIGIFISGYTPKSNELGRVHIILNMV